MTLLAVTRATVKEAIQATFSDDVVILQMQEAVLNSYYKVLDDELWYDEHLKETWREDSWSIKRKRNFAHSWINSTMQQAWASVENSETVLTPENISTLFGKLIGPFAQAHEYSCIEKIFRRRREGGSKTSKRRKKADGSYEADPHPECASEEDCIGNRTDNLVQHMLGGDVGDTYCVTCWRSFIPFVLPGARMEARWKDGDHAGESFLPS